MTRTEQSVALVLALTAGVIGGAIATLYIRHEIPQAASTGDIYLTFDRGAGTQAMGRALADAGVIGSPWQFTLMRILNPDAKLQAGEYRFSRPASVYEVYTRIARGDVDFTPFTVPEGSNMFDIAALLDASGLISGDEFLLAASDPTPIHDLAPYALTQEGYLFPATYRVSHSTTARGLCDLMTAQFRKEWKRLATGSSQGLTPVSAEADDVHSVVTMASLVERETRVPEERPLVAGVFANRMRQRMRLNCDATTIYAALLDRRYHGIIHRSDLDNRNPYNTYQNDGLPPGPIANPGRPALLAALHPAKTDYLFFVAKATGEGHRFSATLAAHERAVRDYRSGN